MNKKRMIDSLFDAQVSPLDVVKFLLLLVTMFSTWHIMDILTPDTSFAFIREIATVAVVEGAFLGFEYATKNARSELQVKYATVGFFWSLVVILMFAFVSGFLEFAGPEILQTSLGTWLGIVWKAQDVVSIFALLVTISWFGGLASLYRLYDMEDPEKKAQVTISTFEGEVSSRANDALQTALTYSQPVISVQRTLAKIQETYGKEFTPAQMQKLLVDVEAHLKNQLGMPGSFPVDDTEAMLDQILARPLEAPVPAQLRAETTSLFADPSKVIFEPAKAPNGHHSENPTTAGK